MDSETTTTLGSSQTQIPESEDTPKGSLGFRSLPASLVCILATTPVAGLSEHDFCYFIMARNTISTGEESDLASLGIDSDIDGGSREQPGEADEADAANRTRLELLARQYVTKRLSPEEDARLSIVTERVRRLIPRVTAEDLEALERMAEHLNRIGLEDAARRDRLRIA